MKVALGVAAVVLAVLLVGVLAGRHDPIDMVAIAEQAHGFDLESRFLSDFQKKPN